MGGYLAHFSVYTFAMIGFLFIAVMVYNKTGLNSKKSKKDGGMAIEDSLNLSPRKTLHVVKVGDEKFLIAADVERTEFLAKLDGQTDVSVPQALKNNSMPRLVSKANVTPLFGKEKEQVTPVIQGNTVLKNSAVQFATTRLSQVKNINLKKPPVMREILRKLEV